MKTFLDSGVLLHAWRGETLAGPALRILDDDTREFFTSQLVRLELLPKPRFEKRPREIAFYEAHFAGCESSEPLSAALGAEAEKLAARHGLAGPDALQIAAAIRQGVEEFYTSEKPGKPMFRVKEIKIFSLFTLLD
ncbi:MAG TPA: PIN domain-containing protein [Candidatus Angelobacter sp.]|nr:PIN domain-containing protein [Candidatus Angelobacter sp.]